MRGNTSCFIVALLVAAVLLFDGCLDPEETPGRNVALDGRVLFSITEGWSETGERGDYGIILNMETEKIYSCCNYRIITELDTSHRDIRMRICCIHIPGICLTALGPAKCGELLEIDNGTYRLAFRYNSLWDEYRLVVTDSVIEINGQPGEFTAPADTIYRRQGK